MNSWRCCILFFILSTIFEINSEWIAEGETYTVRSFTSDTINYITVDNYGNNAELLISYGSHHLRGVPITPDGNITTLVDNPSGLPFRTVTAIVQPAVDEMKTKLNQTQQTILSAIEKNLQDRKYDSEDISVYTGLSGIALLYLRLYFTTENTEWLMKADRLIDSCLPNIRGGHRECTFLCGDAGPMSIAAVIRHLRSDSKKRDEIISTIVSMKDRVCGSQSVPNEMLYGRSGYLYTLLFLQKHIGEQAVDKSVIIQVYNDIIRQGLSSGHCSHLSFTWHDKHYFGAAHGISGILYQLMQVKLKYPELDDRYIKPTIDYLLSKQFPSKNFPSSLESSGRDTLVHWCHGAAGFVYMFQLAYKLYGDAAYKTAVVDCSNVVWDRGLLKKGFGLCHGASGNGYAFLSAYRATNDPKHLSRLYHFADWCRQIFDLPWLPERPFSLFEGMAGTAHFIQDVLYLNANSGFPAFEL